MIEDETVGWHRQMSGSCSWTTTNAIKMVVACCSPWGSKESDMTDWLTDRPEPFPCHLANTTPSSQAQLP